MKMMQTRNCRGCLGRVKKKLAKKYCRDCLVDMNVIPTKNIYSNSGEGHTRDIRNPKYKEQKKLQ